MTYVIGLLNSQPRSLACHPSLAMALVFAVSCSNVHCHPGFGDVRRDPVARSQLEQEVRKRGTQLTVGASGSPVDIGTDLADTIDSHIDLGLEAPADALLPSDEVLKDLLLRDGALSLDSIANGSDALLAEAHNGVAVELLESNHYRDAEPEVLKAVALAPSRPEIIYNLGVVMSGLGRHIEAEHAYERALRLKPSLTSAHFNLARTHMALANSLNTGGAYFNATARQDRLHAALYHLNASVDSSESTKSREETYKSMEEVHHYLGYYEPQHYNSAWEAYSMYLDVAPHEGLKAWDADDCHSVARWLEDRLLELELPNLGTSAAYPDLPAGVHADLCRPVEKKQPGKSSLLQQGFQHRNFAPLSPNHTPWTDGALVT